MKTTKTKTVGSIKHIFKATISKIQVKRELNNIYHQASLQDVYIEYEGNFVILENGFKGNFFIMLPINTIDVNDGDIITFKAKLGDFKLCHPTNIKVEKSLDKSHLKWDMYSDALEYLSSRNINVFSHDDIKKIFSLYKEHKDIDDITFLPDLINTIEINGIGFKKKTLYYRLLREFTPIFYFVYRLYKDGTIIYIGSSTNLDSRIKAHMKDKDFDLIDVCLCEDKEHMLRLEHYNIMITTPILNSDMNLNYARDYNKDNKDFFVKYCDLSNNILPYISKPIRDKFKCFRLNENYTIHYDARILSRKLNIINQ